MLKKSTTIAFTIVLMISIMSQVSIAATGNNSLLLMGTAMFSPGFQLGLEYEYRWPNFGFALDVVSNFIVPDQFFSVQGHMLGKAYLNFNDNWSAFLGFGVGAGVIDLDYTDMMFAIDANVTLGLEVRAGYFIGRIEGGYNPFFPIGYYDSVVHTGIVRLGLGFVF